MQKHQYRAETPTKHSADTNKMAKCFDVYLRNGKNILFIHTSATNPPCETPSKNNNTANDINPSSETPGTALMPPTHLVRHL